MTSSNKNHTRYSDVHVDYGQLWEGLWLSDGLLTGMMHSSFVHVLISLFFLVAVLTKSLLEVINLSSLGLLLI